MSWDSEEKDILEPLEDIRKIKEQTIKDKRTEFYEESNPFSKSIGTEIKIPRNQEKKHRVKYKHYETINLLEYDHPFYFSRIRVMLLIDDVLETDVISIGRYLPNIVVNTDIHNLPLQYLIGDNDKGRLKTVKSLIINILNKGKDSFQLTSSSIFHVSKNFKVCRLYLLEYKVNETIEVCNFINEEIKKNNNKNLKLRGRNSNYVEVSLGDESDEHTYIHILSTNIDSDKSICIGILMKARQLHK